MMYAPNTADNPAKIPELMLVLNINIQTGPTANCSKEPKRNNFV